MYSLAHRYVFRRVPLIVVAAHLLYVAVLPSLAGKAIAAFGALLTVVLTIGPRLSQRFASHELDGIDERRSGWSAAFFALPLLSFIAQPNLAFWRIDGRALLIIAWLAALSWVLLVRDTNAPDAGVSQARPNGLPAVTRVFILWSALFWLMLIWDVGVGQAVLLVSREDRLITSFQLWETRPASQHLFLVWLDRESFERGIAYTNHLHPINFFFYACSKLVHVLTGQPMYVGRNLTPFVMASLGAAAYAALVSRMSPARPHGVTFHGTLFLSLGFFLSQWHFWVYPYASNFDTMFPLVAYLATIVWASASPRISIRNARWMTASLVLFAAFGWVYTPLLVVALWCVFGRVQPRFSATIPTNRPLVRASILAGGVALVIYAVPIVLVKIKGYDVVSSPFLFRSGLDGDTRYFNDVLQAVMRPYAPSRTLWELVFPTFIPFALGAVWTWRAGAIRRRRMGRQAVFLLAPYAFTLAVFPQAVSIHPYLFDVLLVLPVALLGSTWTLSGHVQRRLRGAGLLAALLLAATLIMANFIEIAQGMARLNVR